ncbi:DUF3999 family protein [Desulfitobacterium sp. PCE1]|uniref:DUF3999 family protein n=1 Tax=Desulfitobacterium sp. PCE1 TaxID=146907 RepID=UPI00036D75A7|nr:DUF3999 family protein [Desulfitobacterium sp. PCE1]
MSKSIPHILASFSLCMMILSIIFPIPAYAAISDFRYRAPVTVNSTAASYNLLELTDEVLGQTEIGSLDLRLYNGNEEIPYALVTERDFDIATQVERAKILNQGKDAQGNLQLEVLVPSGQWIKQLAIITSAKNFIRSVNVEGSHNQQDWITLTENSTIFDLTDEQKSRHFEVNLPQTNFPYLRLIINNDGKGDFHCDGVSLSLQNQAVALNATERSFSMLAQSNNDGVQEYTFDLHQSHLPVEELEIITDAVNFNRRAEIYASDNNKDWDQLAQGELFSYQLDKLTAKQSMLKLNSNVRYLKLKIINQDNAPLDIRRIRMSGTNPLLVFPVNPTKETSLYWGNHQIQAPIYDIEKFKGNMDFSKIPLASLGAATENDAYQFKDIRPWTERNSWLLQGILVIVVVSLLIIIVRSIRKISSE